MKSKTSLLLKLALAYGLARILVGVAVSGKL